MASERTAGRAFVITAGIVGLFFFIQRLSADDALFNAFLKGAGAAFGVMVLTGAGRRLWQGDRVSGAQGPGGFGLSFVARAALRPLRALEERITAQMDAVNERIRVVEEDVTALKESAPRPEIEE